MIVRYPIECETCSTPHTLRISIGHNPWQEHTISCNGCSEDIKVGMKVYFDPPSWEIVNISNCIETTTEGIVVNLHPEYIIPEDLSNMDFLSPWLVDAHKNFDFNKINPDSVMDFNGIKFVDAFKAFGGNHQLADEWSYLKKAWSLHLNDNESLSKNIIEDFFKKRNITDIPSIFQWQYGFFHKLISPGYTKHFEVIDRFFYDTYKMNSVEFDRFVDFYINNLQQDHTDRFFEIFSEYFKSFSEFSQALLFSKNNKAAPEKSKATSVNFKQTKMLYGNAFEAYTSNLVVVACVNNINAGRPFGTHPLLL